jgi:hypothetical protein
MDKKTIVIEKEVHQQLKVYCKRHKLKLNEYINNVLQDHLEILKLAEASNLPLILKDNKGQVVDVIYCPSISLNYEKNLPKELTLVRKAKDEGYIANYVQKS